MRDLITCNLGEVVTKYCPQQVRLIEANRTYVIRDSIWLKANQIVDLSLLYTFNLADLGPQ